MRIFSLILAIGVSIGLYFLIVDRKSLVIFLGKLSAQEQKVQAEVLLKKSLPDQKKITILPHVIVSKSKAVKANNILLLRGLTEAARKVEVRAEISGAVISDPRSKGSKIQTGETLCKIAAGTRFVTLSEAKVRLLRQKKKQRLLNPLDRKVIAQRQVT